MPGLIAGMKKNSCQQHISQSKFPFALPHGTSVRASLASIYLKNVCRPIPHPISQLQYSKRRLRQLSCPNVLPTPEAQSYRYSWVAIVFFAPSILALLSLAFLGASQTAVYREVSAFVNLIAALAFLLYFWSSLVTTTHNAAARLAAALRPAQDALLNACCSAAVFQLMWLMVRPDPVAMESPLLPLYAAGYLSLLVLRASQTRPRLKGRVRLEIEAGEGERHSIMAQGTRLAARNYIWTLLLIHLTAMAVTTGGGSGLGGGWCGIPPWAHGTLAALYGVAGVLKFLPRFQQQPQ